MEYHIDVLTQGLADGGHAVSVITTSHPEGKETETLGNVKIHYLPGTKPGAYSPEWWQSSEQKVKEILSDVDVLHSQSIACYSALRSIRDREGVLVTTSHGTPITDAVSYGRTVGLKASPIAMGKTLFYFKHHRNVYRSSRKVIAVSDQLAEHIIKWGFASKENVTTIPNGIDLDRFNPGLNSAQIEDTLGLQDEHILLFLGRVRREKGVDLAIKALPELAKRVGPVKLVIVGEGDFSDEVRPLAESLGVGDQVLAVGKIAEELVPVYHSMADVFLMPSTRWEALPLSLLEAMASGKVVVASEVGGIPSVVRDGLNGILVQKGSLESLVEGCVRALSPSSAEVPVNARRTAEEQFDAKKMVDRVSNLYEQVVS
jgi:glycosyltransferase involved in cell wall biosynthesis